MCEASPVLEERVDLNRFNPVCLPIDFDRFKDEIGHIYGKLILERNMLPNHNRVGYDGEWF